MSNTAEHAVQITNDTNIPIPDQVNSVRRPSLSTRNAAEAAAQKLKIWRRLDQDLVSYVVTRHAEPLTR